jgi:hypothetical protein
MVSEDTQQKETAPFVEVVRVSRGWVLRDRDESGVTRLLQYDDWHRVERAVAKLRSQGRQVTST